MNFPLALSLICAMFLSSIGCQSGQERQTNEDASIVNDAGDSGPISDGGVKRPPMTECAGGLFDTETLLCWQNPPRNSGSTLSVASKYCETLKSAGHTNWYLPTIEELRSLLRGCPATEPEGLCRISNNSPWENHDKECHTCMALEGPSFEGCYWDYSFQPPCTRTCLWPESISAPCVGFWSSSSATFNGKPIAWIISFETGWLDSSYIDENRLAAVRCVRKEI
jgi:Protein of unknown function (DUF1566)